MTHDTRLAPFTRLVGTWITEATHPMMPGVVVHGSTNIEWLEGEHFLIVRAHTDHKDFPDAIIIIGDTEHDHINSDTGKIAGESAAHAHGLRMHYFDDRGVFRNYETSINGDTWQISGATKEFAQRFIGTLKEDDTFIDGLWQMQKDGAKWEDDLKISYRLQLPK